MNDERKITPIAYIRTDFPDKFGVPRQSGRIDSLEGEIVFLPEFGVEEAFRGIDEFSHLWLVFDFSLSHREEFSPTVRPPRLGGNKRVGVFASRSPFRPNSLGLSCVKLCGVEKKDGSVVLRVSGIDLVDNTPIYDVKPYLKYTDAHTDATGGFSDDVLNYKLAVDFPQSLLDMIPKSEQQSLITALENDPRPGYKDDGEHEYGMKYSDFEVFFKVKDCILTVTKLKT